LIRGCETVTVSIQPAHEKTADCADSAEESIHRFTQIFTDWLQETQKAQKRHRKHRFFLCALLSSVPLRYSWRPLRILATLAFKNLRRGRSVSLWLNSYKIFIFLCVLC